MLDVGERRALGDDDDAPVVHLVDAGIEAAGQRLHGLAHDAQMVRLLVIGPEQTQMQLARHAAGAVTVEARDEVEQQLVIGQRPRLFVGPLVHPAHARRRLHGTPAFTLRGSW